MNTYTHRSDILQHAITLPMLDDGGMMQSSMKQIVIQNAHILSFPESSAIAYGKNSPGVRDEYTI